MTLRELCARLLSMLRRREADRELEEEIATHLELAKADHVRRGMDPDEARRLAAVRFGSTTSAKEGVWEQRTLAGLTSFIKDAAYVIRGLRHSPGFTLVTILTLALGIGLCSMMFSIVNAFLLRPLPGVSDPERLATIQAPVAYPYFESYRDQSGVNAAAAFIGPAPFNVALEGPGNTRPERIFGHLVSPEYFSTLGVTASLGRFFDPSTEGPGDAPVVVVTERFWRTRLHADPDVVGSSLRVNGRKAIIIGVGPQDFFGAGAGLTNLAEMFVPVTADPGVAPELADDVLHRSTQPAFRVLLRLAPGMTLPAAEAALDELTRRMDEQTGKRDPDGVKKGKLVRLMPAGTVAPVPREARSMILIYYGLMVTLILSLTCANLAGLILARGSARSREIAIRLSIGAGRFRVFRQLLTESVILAFLGGAAGLGAAQGLLRLLTQLRTGSGPSSFPIDSTPDLRVALFAFLASTLAAVGFGLMPALTMTRPDLATVLKASSGTGPRGYRRFGWRNFLVVWQMAAAMMLTLIMGFAIVGVRYGVKRDPGFDTTSVSLFSLDPARDGLTPGECVAMFTRLPERLARVAGVESAALADQPPLTDAFPNTAVSVPSMDAHSPEAIHSVVLQKTGPGFFATLGARVVRGTEFGDHDLRSDPASGGILPAIINHTAAHILFGDADPLGRRIRQDQRIFQVAGVVAYDRPVILMNKPVATVFLPLTRSDLQRVPAQDVTVVVRSRMRVDLAAIRRELAAIDGRLTLFNAQTMREYLAQSDRSAQIVSAFYLPIGLFGLVLACLGVAGVTAQTVQRRRKEIGIRMALGARRAQLLRLVMQEGAVMVSAGAGAGYAGAWVVSRVLAAAWAPMAQLIGWSAGNPVLIFGVPSVLILLAVIACYLPARRSATIDPLVALRVE